MTVNNTIIWLKAFIGKIKVSDLDIPDQLKTKNCSIYL